MQAPNTSQSPITQKVEDEKDKLQANADRVQPKPTANIPKPVIPVPVIPTTKEEYFPAPPAKSLKEYCLAMFERNKGNLNAAAVPSAQA